jgi:hypothetical protein
MSAATERVVTVRAPSLRPVARPASDAELGCAWWNGLTERERWRALHAADSAVPAEAWEWWKRTPTGCEEQAHG